MRNLILFILLCGLFSQLSFAQERKIYSTKLTPGTIELDGQFSEPAWDGVEWAGDFIQVDPDIGARPSFQTQFKILFDQDHLYVAISALDDQPKEIVNLPTARDFFDGDYVEINIDSDADQKDAFSFTATAAGIRGDEHIITSENWLNDWNPHWEVKTTRHEKGWNAEMKIPLSELELYIGAKTWGIQVNRYIERIDELSSWNAVPDEDKWTEYFGQLEGVSGLRSGEPISVSDLLPARLLEEDFRILFQSLQESYPSLYRYRSPAFLTSFYDKTVSAFDEEMTRSAFGVAVSAFVSIIGDGHMQVAFPDEFQKEYQRQLKRLPFAMKMVGTDVIITTNYLDVSGPLSNARLVALNGKSINEVLNELAQIIPSDGYNLTGKYHRLFYNFDFYYSLIYGNNSRAEIDFIPFNAEQPSSATVDLIDGETFEKLQSELSTESEWNPFSFRIVGDIGVLNIKTFNGYDDFTNFIDESFQEIADLQLDELIIDLRSNGGGEETNAIYLYSHLATDPFLYYDRYEVKTPQQPLSGQQSSLVSYETMNLLRSASSLNAAQQQIIDDISASDGRLIDPNELQMPASINRFTGTVVVLIDGGSFSATSELCAIMARDQRATFVGTETGGGLDGNTSGLYDQITLPHSGLKIKVPLIKYVSAIGEAEHQFGRGVMPNITVYPTQDSEGQTVDNPLNFSIDLLKSKW
ncbi:MAG: S41 family peptidase [Bacteroidota bacterium]